METILFKFENRHLQMQASSSFIEEILRKPTFKVRLNKYVLNTVGNVIHFKDSVHYDSFNVIIDKMKETVLQNCDIKIDPSVLKYIEEKQFFIDSKYRVGNSIKRKDGDTLNSFNKFRCIVDSLLDRKLREKQMWDAFYLTSMGRACNFSVPGAGKTSTVLGMYAYLKHKNEIDRIIVIGPKNSFKSWIDEFRICFAEKENLNYISIQDSRYKSTNEKREALIYNTGSANLVLLNYESISQYQKEVNSLIDSRVLLVFDEIHRIKNPDGIRAASCIEAAGAARYIVALTGTPIPNTYVDVYNTLNILYKEDYNNFFGFTTVQLKNATENKFLAEKINNKIRPFFCRTKKNELSVPLPNDDILVSVDATVEENEIFKYLKEKYNNDYIALMVRLYQLESNLGALLTSIKPSEYKHILDDNTISTNATQRIYFNDELLEKIKGISITSKTRKTVELTKQLVLEGKVVLIWGIFLKSIEKLHSELNYAGIVAKIITGQTSLEERERLIDEFKERKFDVLLSNPQTLAESVSLHKSCHDAIYFEYSYDLVHLLQSKDRIHRLGLPEGQYTQYYFMTQSFELDSKRNFSLSYEIYKRLKKKENMMLKAIDLHILENLTSFEDDLKIIFNNLFT